MSLGVDLVPHKTCSLNCIYCECGATTHLTLTRKNYVSPELVKTELSAILTKAPHIDHITFSGSGEPTLHKSIGDIIDFLHKRYPQYRVAVLTNGTLFYRKDIREQLRTVDVLKVSLDGVSDEVFHHINRPCSGLQIDRVIDGLMQFRKTFSKQFWIEVFLVPGVNDTPNELSKLKHTIEFLNPHKIQLNTMDRPGTESWVKAEDREKLEEISAYLFNADIIIAPPEIDKTDEIVFSYQQKSLLNPQISERILATIKRRPCTIDDMARFLSVNTEEIKFHLDVLVKTGKVIRKEMPRGAFYQMRF